jgi:integral membrane protein (TIGR00529 family)
MDPSLALIISIFVILVLIRKVNISLSIFAGAFILGLLTIGTESFYRILVTAISYPTLKLLAIVTAAFTLGYSMEYFKLLDAMSSYVSRMIGMLSVAVLPLIIGLLPMPGGALISAIMIRDLVKQYGINPEKSTYVNYWFRHVWVTVWPLYPNIIIAAAVVEIDYAKLILATYPIAIAALLSAVISVRWMNVRRNINISDLLTLAISLYPILLVATLALALRLDLLITLLIALFILFIHKKAKPGDIVAILRRTVDAKIIILIFAVMSYKDLIVYTNAAEIFFEHLRQFNFPPAIASFILSFLVGFATGIELSYSTIALPLLTAFTGIGDSLIPKNLMLVIAAGYIGVMLSPMHLCLALTSEYFKADLSKVYRLLLPSIATVALLTILFFVI